MSLSAPAIFAQAPLGAIIRWSDGSPRPPAHHVAVGLVERRRVALHGHAQLLAQLYSLGIGHAELLG